MDYIHPRPSLKEPSNLRRHLLLTQSWLSIIACLVANDLASYRKQVVSFIFPSYPEPLGVCGIELQGGVLQLQLDEHFQDRETMGKGG